jgi:CDP-glycerol glycerophosphotransferase (TagB/SpsB family)
MKTLNNLLRIIENILTIIVPTLLVLIPKKKSLWVFSAWSGLKYSDNPKAFYEYTSENTEINSVWITKDKKQLENLRNEGVNAFYYLSYHGIKYQAQASIIFLSHNIGAEFCRPLISRNTLRINLWHGMPLKKIRFDDLKTYSSLYIWIKSSIIYRFISNERYDYITSLGPESTKILSSAFRLPASQFIEVGFPRNDNLKIKPDKTPNSEMTVLYMPTFRGGVGTVFNLFEKSHFNFDKVENILNTHKIRLVLKIHPANILSDANFSRISASNRIVFSDIESVDLLNQCDALITDYSSVIFDFVLTKKNIVFFPYDQKEYFNQDRGTYFNYNDISSGCSATTMDECIELLMRKNTKYYNNEFLYNFHKYKEGSASERLFNFLQVKN